MVLAMLVMLYFAGKIADFVDRHPTIKVLRLSFPDSDWRDARRGRTGPTHRQRVHLRGDVASR